MPYREPWSYLRYWIRDNYPKSSLSDALDLAKQAERFYKIAVHASSETSPLLWYYSFLNLAKTLLLKTPHTYSPSQVEHARHGIADPADNNTGYVKLSRQAVSVYGVWMNANQTKLQVFPALCEALGTPIAFPAGGPPAQLSIKHLLSHTVSVHRAFATAYGTQLRFCRVETTALEQRGESGKAGRLWHSLNIEALDVRAASAPVKAFERPDQLRAVSPTLEGSHCFAVMFYLGSIVRYKPHRFASLVGNKYHWLIEEFLQVCPKQFVALMINEITDSELPYFDY